MHTLLNCWENLHHETKTLRPMCQQVAKGCKKSDYSLATSHTDDCFIANSAELDDEYSIHK